MKRFITSDGLSLAYQDEGAGTPVVCLAGLTRNARDFDAMADKINPCRLIRMDYRGRGQSDYDPDFNNYSLEVEARDLLELMAHLNIAKTAIIGTSRGGLIAMLLAATSRSVLTGVILNDIGPELNPRGLDHILSYIGKDPDTNDEEELVAKMPGLHPGFEGVSQAEWQREVSQRWKVENNRLVVNYDPALRDAMLSITAQPPVDLWPLFDALRGVPLGLIRGANSNLLSTKTADEMRRRRPDMVFANVPGRGHVPFLDEPQSVELISKFIGDLS